jgi:hypothetical protein
MAGVRCRACNGSGKCPGCRGSGAIGHQQYTYVGRSLANPSGYAFRPVWVPCSRCGGRKQCRHCGGTGTGPGCEDRVAPGGSYGPDYGRDPGEARRPGVSAFRRLVRVVVCLFLIAVLGGMANPTNPAGPAAAIVALVLVYNFIRMVLRILGNILS